MAVLKRSLIHGLRREEPKMLCCLSVFLQCRKNAIFNKIFLCQGNLLRIKGFSRYNTQSLAAAAAAALAIQEMPTVGSISNDDIDVGCFEASNGQGKTI